MHAGWSCIRLSDGPNIKLVESLKFSGWTRSCLLLGRSGFNWCLLLQDFSGVVSQPSGLRVSQYVVSVESSSLNHHRPYS